MAQNFYITTAISYVNGAPHLGHAYEVIAADVMARYKKLDGFDVYFLTGTDEHGQKVAKTAEEQGKNTQGFCDEIAAMFQEMTGYLGVSNNDFIRTTEERHKKASQAIWQKLEEKGDIYLDKYAGWYSVRDEAFYTDADIETLEDGSKQSINTKTEVTWVEEESYFFKLSAYTEKLLAYYEENPEFIQPKTRYNEVVSFVKGELRDLSISRTSFDWGVPVPNNEKHVMYVWLDALTNYITGLGYPDLDTDLFKKFWPANVHLIGKDILRFHAVYWPAFLMAAELPLPKVIFGHGFLNMAGEKMSKSLGNVQAPKVLIEEYGLDQLRYFLMRDVSFGQDGDFNREGIISRINSDLSNSFGNLIQRSMSMIYKNCEARIPTPAEFTAEDQALLDSAGTALLEKVRNHFDKMAFHKGLEDMWHVISDANSYIDEQAPWGLKKTDPMRMGTVLYVVMEVVRNIALLLQPVTHTSSNNILDQLGIGKNERDFSYIGEAHRLTSGVEIEKPKAAFPRYIAEDTENAA